MLHNYNFHIIFVYMTHTPSHTYTHTLFLVVIILTYAVVIAAIVLSFFEEGLRFDDLPRNGGYCLPHQNTPGRL